MAVSKAILEERLQFWKDVYDKYKEAYIALIEGGVKYYMIDDRQLSRFEIVDVQEMIEKAEDKINMYESMLNGQKARKAFAVVPRDY